MHLFSLLLLNIVTKVLASEIKQEHMKAIHTGKEEVKLSLFECPVISTEKNPKELAATRNLEPANKATQSEASSTCKPDLCFCVLTMSRLQTK